MNSIFALDENLGLNLENPLWQLFLKKFQITPVLYSDMGKLTEDMKKNTILLSYLPAANFFYFRDDTFYTPIANALFSSTNKSKNKSLLIVRKDSPIHNLTDLKGKSYGYIHRYCTSSYFSIVLLLYKNHLSIHKFFSSMKEVGAWQKQIDAVILGKIDATMVSEEVWLELPENEAKTKVIAIQQDLPSPLVLVSKVIDPAILEAFKKTLFAYEAPHAMFSGFVPFQKEQTEKFFTDSALAFSMNLSK